MIKRGHLTLVGGTAVPAIPETPEPQDSTKSKRVRKLQKELEGIEKELGAMRDVVEAAVSLMQVLPMHELEHQELCDLYEMFVDGAQVLEVYGNQLNQLGQANMTPGELKLFARVRNLYQCLRLGIPEAALSVLDVLTKIEIEKAKTNSKSNNKSSRSSGSAKIAAPKTKPISAGKKTRPTR